MGDMADYYNELQEEGGRYFPRMPRVYPPRQTSYGDASYTPNSSCSHCRKCGALCAWRLTATGWRLYSDGGPHQCIARVDDFDILP